MLPALAGVVIVGNGDPRLHQRVLVGRLQRVERLPVASLCGASGTPSAASRAVTSTPLANAFCSFSRRDRPAVDERVEIEEIRQIGRRNGDVGVRPFPGDVGHRKRDRHRHVLRGVIEEAIADVDLLCGDGEILRPHLDIGAFGQDEAAGRQLSGQVVGRGGAGGSRARPRARARLRCVRLVACCRFRASVRAPVRAAPSASRGRRRRTILPVPPGEFYRRRRNRGGASNRCSPPSPIRRLRQRRIEATALVAKLDAANQLDATHKDWPKQARNALAKLSRSRRPPCAARSA